ncbi:MAG: hypothetical protein CMP91_02480 [Gammaproteobacteria bacterium]|nr:hypothetical protein [Gammaproteobacteria bacterium]MAY02956.1 hypothetical protein [Gammaproteobacteria bacterium]|tara:strand:+ start:279216 stop:279815 length:600 start_codon:yes stop_codon:yes gene_type:complete
MKCYYYLSPNLVETEHVSDDLHNSGVDDWFIHIISKNEAGLSRKHLHSSNYLETMDLIREGLIGAGCGFLVGLVLAGLTNIFQPFGPGVPLIAYACIVFFATCFGAWQGGLVGISNENKKLEHFHDDIQAGKYLILVYAHKNEEEKVKQMMAKRHPDTELVGCDSQFFNPFSKPNLVRQDAASEKPANKHNAAYKAENI